MQFAEISMYQKEIRKKKCLEKNFVTSRHKLIDKHCIPKYVMETYLGDVAANVLIL